MAGLFGAYYSNYSSGFDNYLDFSQSIDIQVSALDTAVVEVYSGTLPLNTDVEINGQRMVPCSSSLESGMCFVYFHAGGNGNYTISLDPRQSQSRYHNLRVKVLYEDRYTESFEMAVDLAMEVDYPAALEFQRELLRTNLQGSQGHVYNAIKGVQTADMVASAALKFVTPKLQNATAAQKAYPLKYEFALPSSGAAGLMDQKDFLAVSGMVFSPEHDDPVSAATEVADSVLAFAQLLRGNPIPAWQEIISNKATALVYGAGVVNLYGQDETIDAAILAEHFITLHADDQFGPRSKSGLIVVADIEAENQHSGESCGFFGNLLTSCSRSDYDKDLFYDYYTLYRDLILFKARQYQELANHHLDVDGDGIVNSEDLNPNSYDDPIEDIPSSTSITAVAEEGSSSGSVRVYALIEGLVNADLKSSRFTFDDGHSRFYDPGPGKVPALSYQRAFGSVAYSGNVEIEVTTWDGRVLLDSVAFSVQQEEVVDVEYDPHASRVNPDALIDALVGDEIEFKVRGYDTDSNLSHVIWSAGPSLELLDDSFDDFADHETKEGTEKIKARVLDDNNGDAAEITATVFDSLGNSDSTSWYITARTQYAPVLSVTAGYPLDGVVQVPLGRTDFGVSLYDQDDNSGLLLWYLNGELIESDGTGGGNPSLDKTLRLEIFERSVNLLEAVVTDADENEARLTWEIEAGYASDGNIPPIIEEFGLRDSGTYPELPYEVFRVGASYEFLFQAYDPEVGLVLMEVFFDDALVYQYDNTSGVERRSSMPILNFPTPGDVEVRLRALDNQGAETIKSQVFTVLPADDTSSQAPLIAEIHPPPGSTYYSSSKLELDFIGHVTDPEFDQYSIEVSIDGVVYLKEGYRFNGAVTFDIDDSIPDITSGTHTVTLTPIDLSGVRGTSVEYTAIVGQQGNSRPTVVPLFPPSGQEVNVLAGENFEVFLYAEDLDGDLSYVEFDMSDVGDPDPDDTRSISGIFDSVNNTVNPTKSGQVSATVYDNRGNSQLVTFQVNVVSNLGNSAPFIANGFVPTGTNYVDLKEDGIDLQFDLVDLDGDLVGWTLYQNGQVHGIQTQTYSNPEYFDDQSVLSEVRDSDVVRIEGGSNWRPLRNQPQDFELELRDSKGNTSSYEFTLIQIPAGQYNHSPVVPSSLSIELDEGTLESVDIIVSDEEGDSLQVEASGLPDGHSVEMVGTTLVYRADGDYVGSFDFILNWDDGFGGQASTLVNATINNVIFPPRVIGQKEMFREILPSTSVSFFEFVHPQNVVSEYLFDQLVFVPDEVEGIELPANLSLGNEDFEISVTSNNSEGLLTGVLSDPNGGTSEKIRITLLENEDLDSDGDQVTDLEEIDRGLDPDDPSDGDPGSDSDGNGSVGDFSISEYGEVGDFIVYKILDESVLEKSSQELAGSVLSYSAALTEELSLPLSGPPTQATADLLTEDFGASDKWILVNPGADDDGRLSISEGGEVAPYLILATNRDGVITAPVELLFQSEFGGDSIEFSTEQLLFDSSAFYFFFPNSNSVSATETGLARTILDGVGTIRIESRGHYGLRVNRSIFDVGVSTNGVIIKSNYVVSVGADRSDYVETLTGVDANDSDYDNDGILDINEQGDSDNDGVPDWHESSVMVPGVGEIDSAVDDSLLSARVRGGASDPYQNIVRQSCDPNFVGSSSDGDLAWVYTSSGRLSLGDTASRIGYSYIQSQKCFEEVDSNLGLPDAVGSTEGLSDFFIDNIAVGEAVLVVMKLPSPIPTSRNNYFKYATTGSGSGWSEFDGVESSLDGIIWKDGLSQGDSYVRLTLTDGGSGDADGEMNGVIVDPGGIVALNDVDEDGYSDSIDLFPNDPSEWSDNDGDLVGDNADLDDDNDGMPDIFEVGLLDPLINDADEDADGDGSTNYHEYINGTDPNVADFDGSCAEGTARTPESSTLEYEAVIPMVNPASNTRQQSFLRFVNMEDQPVSLELYGIDDSGNFSGAGPIEMTLDAKGAKQINAQDVENGNAQKGLTGNLCDGIGKWRLIVKSSGMIDVMSLIRTPDGFLTNVSESVENPGGQDIVHFANPASNTSKQSFIRFVNRSDEAGTVSIAGRDDSGSDSIGTVTFSIGALESKQLTAQDLEYGNTSKGLAGELGDGAGKWVLTVTSDLDIQVMSMIRSEDGFLTNLSSTVDSVSKNDLPVFFANPSSDQDRQTFLRVINTTSSIGTVTVSAVDDAGGIAPEGDVSFQLQGYESKQFTSSDLELGNLDKGLAGMLGAGSGRWRLQISSDLDLEVMSLIRTSDGFLTNLSSTLPEVGLNTTAWIFNPASNDNQVSILRVVNTEALQGSITISAIDDQGNTAPGGNVGLTIDPLEAVHLTAKDLEEGSLGTIGSLGDGSGKWRLEINSDVELEVQSLLTTPAGFITNLSKSISATSETSE
ncbi:MAG: hypothetical protein JJ921_00455 [Pseudomonadales bacterium]|nr:hypothetical protein [Pseudomonadales bacterium]MBO7004902.1 hypothetical protein [Pseudomonadales bacterium]